MKVYISYANANHKFADLIGKTLMADGHNVFNPAEIMPSSNIYETLAEQITKADVIIILFSKEYQLSEWAEKEASYAMFSYEREKDHKQLIIPIVLGDIENCSFQYRRFNCIIIPYDDNNHNTLNGIAIEKAIEQLRFRLGAHAATVKEEKEKQTETAKKVEKGLSIYLKGTMTRLKSKESSNKWFAYILYLLSITPLGAAIYIATHASFVANGLVDAPVSLAIQAVTTLLTVILFISTSKLLFTLAKSFMVEAIRCSDRIHAISFGKFFLDAYGNDATREEVLKAFSAWNIDDGKTSFRNQSGDDYDPKLEKFITVLTSKAEK